jgi:hypothetical protein
MHRPQRGQIAAVGFPLELPRVENTFGRNSGNTLTQATLKRFKRGF